MKQLKSVRSATKYRVGYYGAIYALVLVLLLIVIFASWKTNLPIGVFTRDIAGLLEVNPFSGVISNLGILLWCAAASICLFSFAVLQNLKSSHAAINRKSKFFLLFSGLITSILMFDDLFLLHEEIFPSLNVSERVVYCSYIAIICFYLLKFRKTIFKTEWVILGLGFCCFAASIVIDVLPIAGSKITLLEDGFKLFGIASWFSYFVRLCFQILNNTIAPDFNYHRRHESSIKTLESSKSI